ncbi:MAG TPA: gas vesicle protein GvpO [Bacillota bacterium]|nr:gas vesicle protein GvpO [Bacillota bacterium]
MSKDSETNTEIGTKPVRLPLEAVIQRGKQQITGLTGYNSLAVIEAQPGRDGNWNLKIEFVEREAIPSTMDLIGLYEVVLNADGEVVNFSRKNLRKRGENYDIM